MSNRSMPTRPSAESPAQPTIGDALAARGVSRRAFLGWASAVTATLALPVTFTSRIAKAVEKQTKPSVVYLNFQDCAGNAESMIRAREPAVADLILDMISLDYSELIMAASGQQAEKSLHDATADGGYLLVIEGSVPTKDNGIYCTIGGRTAIDILMSAAARAAGIICVGTCAAFGGLPAAKPNPTGATSVGSLTGNTPLVNLSGCPMNADNLTATIAHFLTFGALPARDHRNRPLFAYGNRIHDNCPRRGHFEAGEFVLAWGDEGHRKGWCLYRMGCKGPSTFANCPKQMWNGGVSWPIGAGVGCAGCTEPGFWDTMTPIYDRLPHADVPGFGLQTSAERIGATTVGVFVGGLTAYGVGRAVYHTVKTHKETAEAQQAHDAEMAALANDRPLTNNTTAPLAKPAIVDDLAPTPPDSTASTATPPTPTPPTHKAAEDEVPGSTVTGPVTPPNAPSAEIPQVITPPPAEGTTEGDKE